MGSLFIAMRSLAEILVIAILCTTACKAEELNESINEVSSDREKKVLPVFQVVKFPNDVCKGSSLNGTCYTSEECSTKGGKNDGSCASGFGVCCTFTLSCGKSSSENSTYIVQSSVTSLTSPCTYTICPAASNICRIRFDFTTFVLATAVLGTTSSGAVPAAGSLNGAALGDCTTDSFYIGGGIGGGTPVICGTNTGYHMIVDADPAGSQCHKAIFNVGGTTTTSRSWNIRVTQYACGDYDNSGWPGCLQYHTGAAGNIASFGWPPTITVVTTSVTHLSNQYYDICIRRASTYCYICYNAQIQGTTVISEATQTSFGVSLSSEAATAESQIGSDCSADWLDIPIANTAANAAITTPTASAAITNVSRFCGRALALGDTIAPGIAISATVCTRQTPFRVGVNFNSAEVAGIITATMATLIEQGEAPGGILGFKLSYWQGAC